MVAPLDLQTIFVTYFAGSMTIFFFVMMALLAYLAARFRMPNIITMIMIGLFIIVMQPFYPLFYVLVVLIAGLLIYFALGRMLK